MKAFCNFIEREDGAALSEYAILLGLIVVGVVTVITSLGTRLSAVISKATTAIPT